MNNKSLTPELRGEICPYCKCGTELVSDKEIYGPNSMYGGMYYRCLNNHDHYVGTYDDNITSLGRLADKELRKWKSLGHYTFDPMWKDRPRFFSSQHAAYMWLSKKLCIPLKQTHFGMFDIEQCKDAIALLINLITEIKDEDLQESWIDEQGVMYNKDRTRLLKCTLPIGTSYSVLQDTQIICSNAFNTDFAKDLCSVAIGPKTKIIGQYAFYQCRNLKEVKLGESLTHIGSFAFSQCEYIKNICIPDTVKYVADSAF